MVKGFWMSFNGFDFLPETLAENGAPMNDSIGYRQK